MQTKLPHCWLFTRARLSTRRSITAPINRLQPGKASDGYKNKRHPWWQRVRRLEYFQSGKSPSHRNSQKRQEISYPFQSSGRLFNEIWSSFVKDLPKNSAILTRKRNVEFTSDLCPLKVFPFPMSDQFGLLANELRTTESWISVQWALHFANQNKWSTTTIIYHRNCFLSNKFYFPQIYYLSTLHQISSHQTIVCLIKPFFIKRRNAQRWCR